MLYQGSELLSSAPVSVGVWPRLVIVARARPALYDHLRTIFAEAPGVQVILDRRRHDVPPPPGVRRDRRRNAIIAEQLLLFGWSIVPVRK